MVYKTWFGVRSTKVKVFRSLRPDGNLNRVDAANELLEKMKIGGLTGTDESSIQAGLAEVSVNKSGAFKLHLS